MVEVALRELQVLLEVLDQLLVDTTLLEELVVLAQRVVLVVAVAEVVAEVVDN